MPDPTRTDALLAEARRRLAARPLLDWHRTAPPRDLRGDVIAAFLADEVGRLLAERDEMRATDGPVWSVVTADVTDAEDAAMRQPQVSAPEWTHWRIGFEDAMRFVNARIRRALATSTPAAPGARGA